RPRPRSRPRRARRAGAGRARSVASYLGLRRRPALSCTRLTRGRRLTLAFWCQNGKEAARSAEMAGMTDTAAGMTAPFDLSQTDHLLTTTRSVRKRLDLTRPVEREVVLECLNIALQAPSGGNSQPWRWLVVDDA